jgi:virginiamycin B lyase
MFGLSSEGASAAPAQGQIEEWPAPTGAREGQGELAVGQGENVWFLQGTTFIGNWGIAERMSGPGQPLDVPLSEALGIDITRGPDGNMWITEQRTSPSGETVEPDTLGRLEDHGSGATLTEFEILPTGSSLGCCEGPVGIVNGPDGQLWFTDDEANAQHETFLGEMTTSGNVTEHFLAAGKGLNEAAEPRPNGIAVGPEGYVWFTDEGVNENGQNLVGRMSPTGAVEEFPVPTVGAQPAAIAAGDDGAMWFTEPGKNRIGRVTSSGAVTEFPVPNVSYALKGLVLGPEGNLWFAERKPVPGFGSISPSGEVRSYHPSFEPTEQEWESNGPESLVMGQDGYIWFTDPRPRNEFEMVDITYRGRFALPHPPADSELPSIYGAPTVGALLSASPGSWNNLPTSEAFQWQRCSASGGLCEDLPGELAPTLLVSSADLGSRLRVLVTAGNEAGTGTAESTLTAAIEAPPNPKVDVLSEMERVVGATLTSSLHRTRGGVVVRSLLLRGVESGSTIFVSCHGTGCAAPPRHKSKARRAVCTPKNCTWSQHVLHGPLVELAPRMRHMNLGRGTRLAIVVTSPGFVGRAFEFVVGRSGVPSPRISCRAPSSSTILHTC